MDYRKIKSPLQLKEYGRNVQIMAEQMRLEPDREMRTRLANEIIRVMTILSPANKDLNDYKKKLWENLYQICDYDLDVDCPYEMSRPEAKLAPPRVVYQPFNSKFKQYGRNIEIMIQKAVATPPSPERDSLILLIANIMKQFLQGYANSYFNDNIIFEHLYILSGGKIKLTSQEATLRPGYALAKANLQGPQNVTSSNGPIMDPNRPKRALQPNTGGRSQMQNRRTHHHPVTNVTHYHPKKNNNNPGGYSNNNNSNNNYRKK